MAGRMRTLVALLLMVASIQVALASSMAHNKTLALSAKGLHAGLAGNKTLSALLQGKLVKGVLVKGAKAAMQSSIGAGAGLAAGALNGLPVTTFAPVYEANSSFTRGSSSGNSHCFPKYRAAIVEKPTFACGKQYSLNITKLGAACVKRTYTKMNNCFKSLKCPSSGSYTQLDHICLPEEVRDAMVGILTVFKVKATLPFMIIPSLKRALTKAVLAPIILPKSLLLSMAFNHTAALEGSNSNAVLVPAFDASNDLNVTVTHPGDLFKLAFEDLSQAGEGVVHALVNKSSNPLEIVTKGILNCNVTDIKKAIPQINEWVASKLQGLNLTDISEAINETFPRCVSKCCRQENHVDTALVLPSPVCTSGTSMNNLLGLCVGGDMGYAPCPGGFDRCTLPSGVPLCLAESSVLGMDSCKVAAALMHNLPKVQCPAVAEEPSSGSGDSGGGAPEKPLETPAAGHASHDMVENPDAL